MGVSILDHCTIFSLVISLLVCAATAVIMQFTRQMWTFRKFRGPLAIPIFGNCYHGEAVYMIKYFSKLRRIYGKVFTYFVFTKAYVIVCEPTAVRRVLSDTKAFPKGEDYTKRFSLSFGTGLVTSEGEKHKKDRCTFGKYFIRSSIANFTGVMNNVVDFAMKTLLQHMVEAAPDGIVNVEKYFAKLALRTFMMFSVGSDYRDQPKREEALCKSVSEGSGALGRLITLPVPLWDFLPMVQSAKNARKIVLEDFDRIVNERKAMLDRGEGLDKDDCLAAMLSGDSMSREDMKDHFMTLISAGHDTTAYFCSYTAYILSLHQDIQEKVIAEINDIIGNREEITADDFTSLKYLQKVMQEVMRVFAIIPMITRYCPEEVHIKEAKIVIPAGSNILVPMFLINRDPDIWEDPQKFDPDRFDENSNFTSAKNGFFPFGYGTRTCIGNTLAQIEGCVFLVKLIKKYKLLPDPNFKPTILAGISLTTSNGLNVKLESR